MKGRKPNVSYFHAFECKCFIHNNGKENLDKFDARSDEGIFLGYSTSSKAYRFYNKRILVVEESMHVVFYETNLSLRKFVSLEDDEVAQYKDQSQELKDKSENPSSNNKREGEQEKEESSVAPEKNISPPKTNNSSSLLKTLEIANKDIKLPREWK